jgi:type VI secretion system secreted protein VgrG
LTEATWQFQMFVQGVAARMTVTSFRGRERISRPFEYDVDVVTTRIVPTVAPQLLGRRAMLLLTSGGGDARTVRGVVARQRVEGHPIDRDKYQLRLKLVPRLWLLRRRKDTRIFQGLTIPQVVSRVLEGLGIDHVWRLDRTYPPVEYVTQYQETDLEFVQRLLAESGLHYYFAHPLDALGSALQDVAVALPTIAAGELLEAEGAAEGAAGDWSLTEQVVISDHGRFYPSVPAHGVALAPSEEGTPEPARVLEFRHEIDTDLADIGVVTGVTLQAQVRTVRVAQRAFDFTQPGVPLRAQQTMSDEDTALPAHVRAEALEYYEHADQYGRGTAERRSARLRLERHTSRILRAEGASRAVDLSPGHRFALAGHSNEELNQEYVLLGVEHTGHARGAGGAADAQPGYHNRFTATLARTTYRPGFRPRLPQQVLETATVVGPRPPPPSPDNPDAEPPPRDDIYTDELGRIKVQFHWDRHGRDDENSSVWIRVTQQWAGPARGAQFVPRVGDEVLVAFLDGDTDRPVVLGSLYNGAHEAPFTLPASKTRSGWRTHSTPGGQGFNELSFEDAHGHEQVHLRAQRNLDVLVRNDSTRTVGANEHITVHNDQTIRVTRDRTEHVGQDLNATTVRNRTVTIGGEDTLAVTGEQMTAVHNHRTVTIDGDDSHTVKGSRRFNTGVDRIDSIGGAYALSVGAEYGQDMSVSVDGRLTMHTGEITMIDATAGMIFHCGDSILAIFPDKILLSAPKIELAGAESTVRLGDKDVRIKAEGLVGVEAVDVAMQSSGASMGLGEDFKANGSQIRLGADTSVEDLASEPEELPSTIVMTAANGNPEPFALFVAVLPDGTERVGILDRNGTANLDTPEGTRVVFPDQPAGMHVTLTRDGEETETELQAGDGESGDGESGDGESGDGESGGNGSNGGGNGSGNGGGADHGGDDDDDADHADPPSDRGPGPVAPVQPPPPSAPPRLPTRS